MPKTQDPPAETGNATLDRAISDLRSVTERHDALKADIEEMRASAGANDERLAAMKAQLDEVGEIKQTLERVAGKVATWETNVDQDELDKREFNIGEVCRALYREARTRDSEPWRDAGFEREVITEAQRSADEQFRKLPADAQRAMGTVNEAKGGILVPSQVLDQEWIKLLKAQLVLPKLGARTITGLAGHRAKVPGIDTGITAYWVGEGDEPTMSDATFKARYLEPHRCATAMRVDNNLLEWSPMMVQELLQTEALEAMAVKMENGFLFGAGTENTPLGVVNTTGVTTRSLNTRFSIRDVPDFEYDLENSNHNIGDDAGFLFHPTVKRLLKKEGVEQFTSQGVDNGQPYMVPGVSDAALEALLGYKFATTSQIPTNLGGSSDETYVIFALWRQLLIGMWGGLRLAASNETGNGTHGSAFLRDETWIVAERTVDALVRRPDAFVVCSDAATSAS